MIVCAYKETSKEDRKISVKVINTIDGVRVIACDIDGRELPQGSLCVITEKGIERHKALHPDMGFDLDKEGRLNVVK